MDGPFQRVAEAANKLVQDRSTSLFSVTTKPHEYSALFPYFFVEVLATRYPKIMAILGNRQDRIISLFPSDLKMEDQDEELNTRIWNDFHRPNCVFPFIGMPIRVTDRRNYDVLLFRVISILRLPYDNIPSFDILGTSDIPPAQSVRLTLVAWDYNPSETICSGCLEYELKGVLTAVDQRLPGGKLSYWKNGIHKIIDVQFEIDYATLFQQHSIAQPSRTFPSRHHNPIIGPFTMCLNSMRKNNHGKVQLKTKSALGLFDYLTVQQLGNHIQNVLIERLVIDPRWTVLISSVDFSDLMPIEFFVAVNCQEGSFEMYDSILPLFWDAAYISSSHPIWSRLVESKMVKHLQPGSLVQIRRTNHLFHNNSAMSSSLSSSSSSSPSSSQKNILAIDRSISACDPSKWDLERLQNLGLCRDMEQNPFESVKHVFKEAGCRRRTEMGTDGPMDLQSQWIRSPTVVRDCQKAHAQEMTARWSHQFKRKPHQEEFRIHLDPAAVCNMFHLNLVQSTDATNGSVKWSKLDNPSQVVAATAAEVPVMKLDLLNHAFWSSSPSHGERHGNADDFLVLGSASMTGKRLSYLLGVAMIRYEMKQLSAVERVGRFVHLVVMKKSRLGNWKKNIHAHMAEHCFSYHMITDWDMSIERAEDVEWCNKLDVLFVTTKQICHENFRRFLNRAGFQFFQTILIDNAHEIKTSDGSLLAILRQLRTHLWVFTTRPNELSHRVYLTIPNDLGLHDETFLHHLQQRESKFNRSKAAKQLCLMDLVESSPLRKSTMITEDSQSSSTFGESDIEAYSSSSSYSSPSPSPMCLSQDYSPGSNKTTSPTKPRKRKRESMFAIQSPKKRKGGRAVAMESKGEESMEHKISRLNQQIFYNQAIKVWFKDILAPRLRCYPTVVNERHFGQRGATIHTQIIEGEFQSGVEIEYYETLCQIIRSANDLKAEYPMQVINKIKQKYVEEIMFICSMNTSMSKEKLQRLEKEAHEIKSGTHTSLNGKRKSGERKQRTHQRQRIDVEQKMDEACKLEISKLISSLDVPLSHSIQLPSSPPSLSSLSSSPSSSSISQVETEESNHHNSISYQRAWTLFSKTFPSLSKDTRKELKDEGKLSGDCGVCLELATFPIITPCSHVFCAKCILNWALINYTCPLCRHIFKGHPTRVLFRFKVPDLNGNKRRPSKSVGTDKNQSIIRTPSKILALTEYVKQRLIELNGCIAIYVGNSSQIQAVVYSMEMNSQTTVVFQPDHINLLEQKLASGVRVILVTPKTIEQLGKITHRVQETILVNPIAVDVRKNLAMFQSTTGITVPFLDVYKTFFTMKMTHEGKVARELATLYGCSSVAVRSATARELETKREKLPPVSAYLSPTLITSGRLFSVVAKMISDHVI